MVNIEVNGFGEGYKAGLQRALSIVRPPGNKEDYKEDVVWAAQYLLYKRLKLEYEEQL